MLYNHINRHAGTRNTKISKGTISLDTAQFVRLSPGSDGCRWRKSNVIDIEVIMENCPIVLLYGTYLRAALMMFVIHTISYIICDSMRNI